jgi:hypothetical protein
MQVYVTLRVHCLSCLFWWYPFLPLRWLKLNKRLHLVIVLHFIFNYRLRWNGVSYYFMLLLNSLLKAPPPTHLTQLKTSMLSTKDQRNRLPSPVPCANSEASVWCLHSLSLKIVIGVKLSGKSELLPSLFWFQWTANSEVERGAVAVLQEGLNSVVGLRGIDGILCGSELEVSW